MRLVIPTFALLAVMAFPVWACAQQLGDDRGGRHGGSLEDERAPAQRGDGGSTSGEGSAKGKGGVLGMKDQVPDDHGGKKGGEPDDGDNAPPKKSGKRPPKKPHVKHAAEKAHE